MGHMYWKGQGRSIPVASRLALLMAEAGTAERRKMQPRLPENPRLGEVNFVLGLEKDWARRNVDWGLVDQLHTGSLRVLDPNLIFGKGAERNDEVLTTSD